MLCKMQACLFFRPSSALRQQLVGMPLTEITSVLGGVTRVDNLHLDLSQ